jgi:osmotically-inducible protein OsmY
MNDKTDVQLKQDIEDELRWDPTLNAAQIGVTVERGTVSLLGTVDTYAERWAAENATKRVGGVRGVAQELKVNVMGSHVRNDSEIAAMVASTLKWDVFVPAGVTARLEEGSVTLAGEVPWNYQRDAAERAIRHLPGVVAVSNEITLKSHTSAGQVKEKVIAALERQATDDAKSIHVHTSGGKVTLTGHASSWQSIEDAANAAWSAPGVTDVLDEVKLEMSFESARRGNEP